jgi:hypothetical protein
MADDADPAAKADFEGVLRRGGVNLGGRPRGSRNKRSLDLARYVEATFGGMTPGQQSAVLCMVSPAELREARAAAAALGVMDLGLSPLMLAMAVKAKRLARAIHCEAKEAWLLMAREREGLMPYVHQKQAQAADRANAPAAIAFMVPEGEESGPPLLALMDDDAIENIREVSEGQP